MGGFKFRTRVLIFPAPAARYGFPTKIIRKGLQLLKHREIAP